MPPKGSKLSDESKRKIREARANQPSAIIGRYGVTQESYDAARVAGLRWCRECKQFLPPHEFYGADPRCIECGKGRAKRWRKKRRYKAKQNDNLYLRDWRAANADNVRKHALKRYGVTPEWYEEKFQEQERRCAICRKEPARRRLCVDECHETDTVRGLLCTRCNAFISGIDDGLLGAALAYLARYA